MSASFTKIVRLGKAPISAGSYRYDIFCKIEFKSGRLSITGAEEADRLSITGVHGPTARGNARGGCGQIDMTWRDQQDKIELAPGWTRAMLARFFEVWDEYHLNDMRPYNSEMRAAGWHEKAKIEMLGYEFVLRPEIAQKKREMETQALEALRKGQSVEWAPMERDIANLPYSVTIWEYADRPEPVVPAYYERAKDLYGYSKGGVKPPERKTLGWLYPKEHPDGLLTRKLREDGPGYGSSWFAESIPEEVLQFLQSLPDTDIKPAWV